jgi:heme/copper-type cytochrome/quinol oxidase subunit 2
MICSLFSSYSLALVQEASNPIPEEAYRQVSTLTLMFAILSILLIMTLSFLIVIRRSQRRKSTLPNPSTTQHIDAWAESGRRFDDSIIEIDVDDD